MKRLIFLIIFSLGLPCSSFAAQAIVAEVNDAVITTKDLEIEVDRLIQSASYHKNVTDEGRAEYKPRALDSLITRELQYQDAVVRGLKPEEEKVNAQMEQIRGRFKSKKEFQAALSASNISEKDLRKQTEKNVLVQMVIEQTVAIQAKASDENLLEYYNKNIHKFMQPDTMRLRIISSKSQKAMDRAQELLRNGAEFHHVAVEMSEDAFSKEGGDIGYIRKGEIYKELEVAAELLQPGQFSASIFTENSWFIVKLEGRKPAGPKPFDEIKEELKKLVEKTRYTQLMNNWMAELKSKAKIRNLLQ